MNTRLTTAFVGLASASAALLKPIRLTTATHHFCFSTMSDDNTDVRAEKQALRKVLRAKMKNVENIGIESLAVWKRVYELPAYKNAKTIGLFLSMPQSEIQTDAILNHAIENGKTVYVPQVGANFEHADMDLLKCPTVPNFHKQWPTNKWNIPEPPSDLEQVVAQPGELDLLIVPGLAFDSNGGRLGQGKGYYDRFIAKMRKDHKTPILVAVGLELQLVDHIPTHEHDFTMEVVVLPNQTIHVPV